MEDLDKHIYIYRIIWDYYVWLYIHYILGSVQATGYPWAQSQVVFVLEVFWGDTHDSIFGMISIWRVMLKTWYPRIHWFTILLSMQNAIFRRTLSCSSLHEAANPRLGVEGKSTANPLRGSTSWQKSTQKSCRWCSRRLAAPSDIIRYNQIYNKHICIYTYDEHIYIYIQYIYIH